MVSFSQGPRGVAPGLPCPVWSHLLCIMRPSDGAKCAVVYRHSSSPWVLLIRVLLAACSGMLGGRAGHQVLMFWWDLEGEAFNLAGLWFLLRGLRVFEPQ